MAIMAVGMARGCSR